MRGCALSQLHAWSPWDGASRAPLRAVLAGLLVVDALLAAWFLADAQPSALSHPDAPRWLLALASNPPALAGCVLVVALAAARFAAGAGRPLAGFLALGGVGVLVEAHAAVIDGPMRFLFFTGACTAGWCFGLLFARWQGLSLRDPRDAQRVEAFGEQGAIAVLAACYLGALASKLAASGVQWVDDAALRPTIAAQHVWGRSPSIDAIVTYVLGHVWPARVLAGFTLLAQASACWMPFSRRGRRVAGVLLLGFHTGVWLLTPIAFPQAMVLLAVFCLAPARALSPAKATTSADASLPPLYAPGASRAVIALAVLCALAWAPGVRAYTKRPHGQGRAGAAADANQPAP